MVYAPAEDSYLLEKEIKSSLADLKRKEELLVLDMGAGSGIQARACIDLGISRNNVLCADIDENSVKRMQSQGLNSILSDLFSNIKKQAKFDLIIFNAPYLPEDANEKGIDTTAGEEGYEIILKFLDQARAHLARNGKILLLFSSLSKPKIILNYAKKVEYKYKKLAEQKIFFERLFVYEFSR